MAYAFVGAATSNSTGSVTYSPTPGNLLVLWSLTSTGGVGWTLLPYFLGNPPPYLRCRRRKDTSPARWIFHTPLVVQVCVCDRFRQDLGKVEESYRAVCERILKRWETP